MEKKDSGVYKLVFSNTQIGHEEKGGFAEIVVEEGEIDDSENPVLVVAPSNSTFQKDAQNMLECIVNARYYDNLSRWLFIAN